MKWGPSALTPGYMSLEVGAQGLGNQHPWRRSVVTRSSVRGRQEGSGGGGGCFMKAALSLRNANGGQCHVFCDLLSVD